MRRSMLDIIRAVSVVSQMHVSTIPGRRRFRSIVYPRAAVVMLGRDRGYSLKQIGRSLGRDHTTILNYARRYAQCPVVRGIAERADVYLVTPTWHDRLKDEMGAEHAGLEA